MVRKKIEYLGLADARLVHEENPGETRSLLAKALTRPMRNWEGDVGDERRNRGRAASCRVECRASVKTPSKGEPVFLTWAIRLITRPIRLGTRVKGALASLI
jgi:hypothetical protein